MHDSLRLRAVSFPFLKDLSGSAADGKSAGLKVDVIKGAATPRGNASKERSDDYEGEILEQSRFDGCADPGGRFRRGGHGAPAGAETGNKGQERPEADRQYHAGPGLRSRR